MHFEHALEHGAKDGGRDAAPVQLAAIEHQLPQAAVKVGDGGAVGKELAVDIFESGQFFIQQRAALVFWLVEDFE